MSVLITRPDERGQELLNLLREQHIFAIHQPLFQIEAGRELPILPAVFSRLNAGDYVFAVSKNAVDFAGEVMAQTGFEFRVDLNYFAVGQKSAAYFSVKAEQAVKYPIHSENSEGVLDLPEMQDLTGKHLVILRAENGRELLAQEAVNRGAVVQCIECYRRMPVETNLGEKISLAKRAGINIIVATSGEILTTLMEKTVTEDQVWLMSCRLVVVGQRIATLAKQYGWAAENIFVLDKADNATLFEMLVQLAN